MPVSYSDPLNVGELLVTVIVTIVLFDLADIRPQVGSFRFLHTSTYVVYFLFQLLLALVAVILVAATQPTQSPVVVAFLSVLTGVVLLQGLAVNVGGKDLVNISHVMTQYKQNMIDFEAKQDVDQKSAAAKEIADKRQSNVLVLTTELRELGLEVLTVELQAVLLQVFKEANEGNPAAKVQEVMSQWVLDSKDDPVFCRLIFAHHLATSNPEHARVILRRQHTEVAVAPPLRVPAAESTSISPTAAQ